MKKNKINRYLSLVCIFSFMAVGLVALMPAVSYAEPEFSWHGQFRVNSYSDWRSDDGTFGESDKHGNRLRWRPTVDVKMSDTVSLHTQLNIGHHPDNISQSADVKLRHAVIQAELFDSGITGMAGFVPISDKFGDTMFSGDWDFNPLALIFVGNTNEISWRAGLGKLAEGPIDAGAGEEDDLDIYIFDVDHESSGLGASVYWLRAGDDRAGAAGNKLLLANQAQWESCGTCSQELDLIMFGARYSGEYNGIKINAFAVGSHLNANNYFAGGQDLKSTGGAGKLEVKIPIQKMTLGIMGIMASGDNSFGSTTGNKSAFITPMSLVGTTGYWGYTGKLNEQGPTDTKIDDHTLNIDGGGLPWSSYSNLGYGLWTVQANLAVPVNNVLSVYLGVGYYESMNAPSTQDDAIGTDFYAQGKLNLGQNLNLEFGVDYLNAQEGHYNNVAANKSRDITTLFSRLQLEY